MWGAIGRSTHDQDCRPVLRSFAQVACEVRRGSLGQLRVPDGDTSVRPDATSVCSWVFSDDHLLKFDHRFNATHVIQPYLNVKGEMGEVFPPKTRNLTFDLTMSNKAI